MQRWSASGPRSAHRRQTSGRSSRFAATGQRILFIGSGKEWTGRDLPLHWGEWDVSRSRGREFLLINRSLRGGLVVVGGLNLGGSLDQLHNAIDVVELAVEKGASLVLMPVSARKQLFDLSDDMATKVNVLFYGDVREAFVKAIAD